MELRHLRYFSAVAESKNLSKASSIINITQPALSRQIKALEDEIGVTLFRRHASGMSLTEGGRVFLRSSQKILSFADAAIKEAHDAVKPPAHSFRLGFDEAAVSPSLYQALNEFGASLPALAISLTEASPRCLLEQLNAGTIDIALVAAGVIGLPETIEEFMLPKRRLQVLLNTQHKYATASQIDIAALSGEPLVVYDGRQYAGSRNLALNACRRAGFEPPAIVEANSYASMIGLIAAGRGYGLYAEDCDLAMHRSTVRSIPTFQNWERPGLSVIWLRSSHPQPREAFLKCLTSMPLSSSLTTQA